MVYKGSCGYILKGEVLVRFDVRTLSSSLKLWIGSAISFEWHSNMCRLTNDTLWCPRKAQPSFADNGQYQVPNRSRFVSKQFIVVILIKIAKYLYILNANIYNILENCAYRLPLYNLQVHRENEPRCPVLSTSSNNGYSDKQKCTPVDEYRTAAECAE